MGASVVPTTAPAQSDDAIARLIQRLGHGDVNLAFNEIVRENREYREARAEALKALDEAKKLLPKPGDLVIPEPQAKAYQEYLALKMTPEQVQALVTKHATLTAQVQQQHLEATRAEAAQSLGWKAPVLATIADARKLEISMRDIQQPDPKDAAMLRTVRQAQVRPAGQETAAWEPLAQYATQHLTDFLPALQQQTDAAAGGPTASRSAPGVPFIPQPSGGAPAGSGPTREQAMERKQASGIYSF